MIPKNHPVVEGSTVEQCPFMNSKQQKEQISNKDELDHSEFKHLFSKKQWDKLQKSRCPMMGELNARNPGYDPLEESVHLEFNSPFAAMLELTDLNKNKSQFFLSQPYLLKHTLFHQEESTLKIRTLEFAHKAYFMEIYLQKANKSLFKEKPYKALYYYDRAMGCLQWLQFKNESYISEDIKQLFTMTEETQSQNIIDFEKNELHNRQQKQIQAFQKLFLNFQDENIEMKGDDLLTKDQIKMRSEFLFTIFLNSSVAYMKLGNYSEAKQNIQKAISINNKSTIALFRMSQCLAYNLVNHQFQDNSVENIELAYSYLCRAFEMKRHEKIYEQPEQVLKVILQNQFLNFQNTDEKMIHYGDFLVKKMNLLKKSSLLSFKEIMERQSQIQEVEKRLIAEGKTPDDSFVQQVLNLPFYEMEVLQEVIGSYKRAIAFYQEQVYKQSKKKYEQENDSRSQLNKLYQYFQSSFQKYDTIMSENLSNNEQYIQIFKDLKQDFLFRINIQNPKVQIQLNYVKREQIKEKFDSYDFDLSFFKHSLDIWKEKYKNRPTSIFENTNNQENVLYTFQVKDRSHYDLFIHLLLQFLMIASFTLGVIYFANPILQKI